MIFSLCVIARRLKKHSRRFASGRALSWGLLCLSVFCALAGQIPAIDKSAPMGRPVRAGLYNLRPFVWPVEGGGYDGFSVALWERCATSLGLKTEYVLYQNIGELLKATESGEVDIGVSGLSIVRDRVRRMRFSFPWYDSGLRIMTTAYDNSLWGELRYNKQLWVYAVLAFIFLALALLMSLVRRLKDPAFPPDWKSGFCLSLLDVMVSVRTGRLEQRYLGWLGNILSLIWLLFGVAAVTYVTSTMTTAMTAISVDLKRIEHLSDLSGESIGVIQGEVSGPYIRALNMNSIPCDNMETAAKLLASGKVRAVVTDEPVLEDWMHRHPEYKFEFAGHLFRTDKLGFAMAKQNADFMDLINRELIRLHDSGELEKLRDQYLGKRK